MFFFFSFFFLIQEERGWAADRDVRMEVRHTTFRFRSTRILCKLGSMAY